MDNINPLKISKAILRPLEKGATHLTRDLKSRNLKPKTINAYQFTVWFAPVHSTLKNFLILIRA